MKKKTLFSLNKYKYRHRYFERKKNRFKLEMLKEEMKLKF
jgi:hypothetical protein